MASSFPTRLMQDRFADMLNFIKPLLRDLIGVVKNDEAALSYLESMVQFVCAKTGWQLMYNRSV